MKFQIAVLFGVIFSAGFVSAGLFEDTHKLIDLVINDEADHIDSKCFSQIKDELIKELEVAAATYIDRVENGMPVFKSGVHLDMEDFIENTLLPSALVSASDDCLHTVKDELRAFLKSRFGPSFKTLDPNFYKN
ncbi:uncharacterized protein LOC105262537 [Musca domestica]|uniref:Uncharacterized protein LOC105262537 n=1 Tax=Musca domestica TaxID=7370 RepID=A0A1I8NIS2_MUSDO|nr:uncharacterized protein LOC105262537 [Musca domestica]